jgi:hypothetical protein
VATASANGWYGYRRLKQKGFEHIATAISKQEEPAHELFPWVHITLSNLKRFLLGTHHKVEQKHLKHYVAEFRAVPVMMYAVVERQ